jgi:hypothetical protein
VLVTTLVIGLLVGILIAALLFVAQQQNYLTARSRVWSKEVPIAEAGIEEAMTHLNSRPGSLAANGWTASGTNFVRTRTFSNAYCFTTIIPNSAMTNTIVSVGFARLPLQTNYSQRTVMALAKKVPPGWGFVAKTTISMNGNPYLDSYDSSDPAASTGGKYDPTKRRDNAGVASTSSLMPAIDTGGGTVYGMAATGPGGTVSGNVGDGLWLSSHSGQEAGHVSDDFNMAILDVPLPNTKADWHPLPPLFLPGLVNGVLYTYVIPAGDWEIPGNLSPGGVGILIQGKVRIWIKGSLSMSGGTAITLATNANLEVYLGGSMDLSGQCVVNPSGITANCAIYGLPTCTSMKYTGTAEAFARIYAPQAAVEVGGNFDFSGSIVANSMRFSGTANIHYDEALYGDGPAFRIVTWEEL